MKEIRGHFRVAFRVRIAVNWKSAGSLVIEEEKCVGKE